MASIEQLTLKYFSPPKGYFWEWADGGEAITIKNGNTICYREDLIPILKALAKDGGLPNLGAVLMVLAVCRGRGKMAVVYLSILRNPIVQKNREAWLSRYLVRIRKAMEMLADLDPELRKGDARIHLLSEVFKHASPKIPSDYARQMIALFETGALDGRIFKGSGELVNHQHIKLDLGTLIHAAALYQNPELVLKTGLSELPAPLREEDFPEQDSEDLLSQLAKDSKTEGLARLTRRLMAAVHLPLRSVGSGEQRFGGVSDITNRGNFDKLLLSELAYDDDTLTARLTNNEALYLRHEEPPVRMDRERIVLVDSTIKMWGLPRVFAVAAGLTCALNRAEGIRLQAYSLTGNGQKKLDLNNKDGITEALSQLDHHLDCGFPLLDFLKKQNPTGEQETILVTHDGFFKNQFIIKNLRDIQSRLSYLITVNRNGDLQFFQMGLGRRRLLNQSRYDLNDILFPPAMKQKREQPLGKLPAFFNALPCPLAMPSIAIDFKRGRIFQAESGEILAITKDQRILIWENDSKKGAIEALPYIEEGRYVFGEHFGCSDFFILVYKENLLKLYGIAEEGANRAFVHDYSKEIRPNTVQFYSGVQGENEVYAFHLRGSGEEKVIEDKGNGFKLKTLRHNQFDGLRKQSQPPISKSVRRIITRGYSTLRRVHRLSITASKRLSLDGWEFVYFKDGIKFDYNSNTQREDLLESLTEPHVSEQPDNPLLKLHTFTFSEGSQAILDFRGFLHLRSSSADIPEITLILALEKTTAAWTSDGEVCGNPYFIMGKTDKCLSPNIFYAQYVERFIRQITDVA